MKGNEDSSMTTETDDRTSWLCREVVVFNSLGIHSRPAGLIVKTARRFEAEVVLSTPECLMVDGKIIQGDTWRSANARSIMALLLLNIETKGVIVRMRARGPDAEEALDAFEELFRVGFYED